MCQGSPDRVRVFYRCFRGALHKATIIKVFNVFVDGYFGSIYVLTLAMAFAAKYNPAGGH